MQQLDYYIATTVAGMMSLAALSLLGVLSIFTLLEQIEEIRNNYTFARACWFVLLSMPRMLYETIPYAALIGCLAGLGLLANSSELMVIRVAGVSIWSISWSAMKPILLLVLVGFWVGEYVLPSVEKTARAKRNQALSGEHQTYKGGFWYREGNIYIHFHKVQGNLLVGVTHYYSQDDHRLVKTLFAERATYYETETYWLLENVYTTDFKAGRIEAQYLPELRWDTKLKPDLLNVEIKVKPARMSISELNHKIAYMQAEGLNSNKFELAYWRKVLQPLATLSLVLIAISFIFGPLREAMMSARVVTGLAIGIAFKFVQDLLAPASMVFGFSPLIAILLPVLACLLIGFLLLRRAG